MTGQERDVAGQRIHGTFDVTCDRDHASHPRAGRSPPLGREHASMTDCPTTRGQEILDELLTEGLRERMRERAKRRKSPWNVVLFPLFFGGMAATWYGFLWLVVGARNLVLHGHVAGVDELMRSGPRGFLAGVCFVGAIFGAIPFGGLVANCILWCIPQARRVFEREARGVRHASFTEAKRDLLLFVRYVSLPAFVLALVAGVLMECSRA
jgi:hypothetical protein